MSDHANPNLPAGETPSVGITPEQLHQAVEKARLEEREKLRTQIDTLRAEGETLKKQVETSASELKKLTDSGQTLSTELTALKSSIKTDGGLDISKAIEQAVKAASIQWDKDHASKLDEISKALAEERTARQHLSLEQLRSKLIQEAGGETALIPELVRGSTEEELKASVETAKVVFQRAVGQSKSTPPPTARSNDITGAGGVLPVIPAVSGTGTPGGGGALAPSVRGMTLKDYAAKRDELKRNAASRYSTAVLTG